MTAAPAVSAPAPLPIEAETADRSRRISRISPRAAVVTLTIVAAILRLLYLGKQSIWHDEALSIALTRTSWRDMLVTLAGHDALSPYMVLLRLWTTCFGESETAARMPSVIFSVATLPPLYVLARRLAGTRVATVTSILFALNGFSIRYAQETRCYSLMALLSVGSWVFFLRCLDAPAVPNYLGYIATSVLGAYTHIFNTLSYPAQWIPIIRRRLRITPQWGLIASIAIICALILPKGLSVVFSDVGQDNWVPRLGLLGVLGFFSMLSGSLVAAHGELLLLTIVHLAAAGSGALALIFRGQKSGDRRWFILLGFAIPIGSVLIVSLVKPLLVARYLNEAFPFFLILCAVGICRARPRWLGFVGLAAIAAMSLDQAHRYYQHYPRDNWRGATAYILSHAKPGDAVIIVSPGSRWPYDYYVSKSGFAEPPPVIFPDWDSRYRVEGMNWTAYYVEPEIFEPIVLRTIKDSPHARIWLVAWPNDAALHGPDYETFSIFDRRLRVLRAMYDDLLGAMDKQYRLNSVKDFYGQPQIRVRLYDRTAGGAP